MKNNACIIKAMTAMMLLGSATAMSSEPTPSGSPAGQNKVIIEPLFDYPSAPDDMTGLRERSNWLLENFWNNLDFKSKKALDQTALNHAFGVFTVPMQWADRDIALKSVDNLIDRARKNPLLTLQLTQAAEENLYGPRASLWIDEIYIPFLEAAVKQKKIPQSQKARFSYQLKKLSNSQPGTLFTPFAFTTSEGQKANFYPQNSWTIVEFGDPECDECRMAKLRLDVNAQLSQLIKEGKAGIYFIMPYADEDWQTKVSDYPATWTVGASEEADETLDLRQSPTLYVFGPDKKIVMKNANVDDAIKAVVEGASK